MLIAPAGRHRATEPAGRCEAGKAGADDAAIDVERAHAATTRATAACGSGPFPTAAAACSS
jgi:hypothetical protein